MSWPTSPTNGATTTVNGILYVYDSTSGSWSPTASSATDFNVGNITATGNLSSSNYSDAGNLTVGGNLTVTGATTFTTTTANITGNANISNNLSVTGNANIGNATSITYTPASATGVALTLTGKDSVGGTGYFDFLRATNTTSGVTNGVKTFRLDSTGNMQILNSAYTSVILQVSNAGQLSIAGASSTNNDATTNWLSFNNNQTAIYDDGNTHIHNRASNQSIWINTNGGDLRLLQQSTVNGGAVGNSIIMGGSQSSTATAYLNVLGSKSYAISSYGYLSSGGAGTVGGSSGTVAYGIYCSNRIQSGEVDVTSDERAKDIRGTIPLDKALQFVRAVDGILYTWRPGFGDDGLKSGFSAQKVHKAGFDHMIGHIPNKNLLGEVDDDGWTHPENMQLTMGYNQAIPYHHEMIKHLLDRIEQLEAKINDLTKDAS
jgi:hypothetical protein